MYNTFGIPMHCPVILEGDLNGHKIEIAGTVIELMLHSDLHSANVVIQWQYPIAIRNQTSIVKISKADITKYKFDKFITISTSAIIDVGTLDVEAKNEDTSKNEDIIPTSVWDVI